MKVKERGSALRTLRKGASKVRPLKVTKRSNFASGVPELGEHLLLAASDIFEESVFRRLRGAPAGASYQTIPFPVSGFSIAITTIFPV